MLHTDRGDCDGLMDCSKCYGELGCFHSGGNFLAWPYRPVSFLPASREQINTRFLLYTRENPVKEEVVQANQPDTVTSSHLNIDRDATVFIVHGFLDNGEIKWIKEMTAAILFRGDYNVIAVDWYGGSGLPYTQATANTRLVGAEIGLLVNYLGTNFGLDPKKVHIIGHSLGSHIAGYAGERIEDLGRITGLDPADPYFQGTDPEVRLDPTDANFVDVIHTDCKPFITGVITSLQGFGAEQPMGHVDFYPNGGKSQPGCEKSNIISVMLSDGLTDGVRHFAACSHLRALDFMTDTFLHPQDFLSYACANYDNFIAGECIKCTSSVCTSQMGFKANASPITGRLYLKTTADQPFNVYHYEVQLTLASSGDRDEEGDVYLQVRGDKASTSDIKLNADVQDLAHGHSYLFLLPTSHDLGQVTQIGFTWECNSKLWNPFSWCSLRIPEILVDRIRIIKGQDQSQATYCSGRHAIASKIKKYFGTDDLC